MFHSRIGSHHGSGPSQSSPFKVRAGSQFEKQFQEDNIEPPADHFRNLYAKEMSGFWSLGIEPEDFVQDFIRDPSPDPIPVKFQKKIDELFKDMPAWKDDPTTSNETALANAVVSIY